MLVPTVIESTTRGDRDYTVRGADAVAYGLVDEVIERRQLPDASRAVAA